MKKIIASLLIPTALYSAAQAAAPITGRYITDDRDGIIEIYACGSAMCGKLAKFLKTPPGGAAQKDINNPNPALRSRTLLGMNVLLGLKADGKEWKGQIYDPRNGKTYRSVVYKGKSGHLVVKGCYGPICRAQNWIPAG
ncbi:MAG: DUF2147 domain-containing protein [Sphingorhabdus sp.]